MCSPPADGAGARPTVGSYLAPGRSSTRSLPAASRGFQTPDPCGRAVPSTRSEAAAAPSVSCRKSAPTPPKAAGASEADGSCGLQVRRMGQGDKALGRRLHGVGTEARRPRTGIEYAPAQRPSDRSYSEGSGVILQPVQSLLYRPSNYADHWLETGSGGGDRCGGVGIITVPPETREACRSVENDRECGICLSRRPAPI